MVSSVFPDLLKIAKVTPVYKKDDDSLFNNYRPVSLLSWFSKIVECVIHSQLHDYFTTQNIYYKSQYAYRENHSNSITDKTDECKCTFCW